MVIRFIDLEQQLSLINKCLVDKNKQAELPLFIPINNKRENSN